MTLVRIGILLLIGASLQAIEPRRVVSLNGTWLFQRDKAPQDQWKEVQVPASFQSHEGTDFHRVGWYRRQVEPIRLAPGRRLLVHFQAAATEAEVWWDGQRLGSHLGGWTPFRFDITDLVRSSATGKSHELRVRLDEKVGHNTQGFLPIVAPHFGGIWQDVRLIEVPETYFDDLGLLSVGDPDQRVFRLELPVGGSASNLNNITVRYRLCGNQDWVNGVCTSGITNQSIHATVPIPDPLLWSFGHPNLYEIEVGFAGDEGDRIITRAAFRKVETRGPQFLLNGQPIQIRGLLNWGFSPPAVEPNPGEQRWRNELDFARNSGFNLMKFCLWIPPQRYLEMADEMGFLTWLEYPTWHPDFSEKHLAALRREFKEFFAYDRNHPSIILRSLTCETGPSADLRVIRSLYDAAHEMIPGALVEDDSSWIGWNRISDFYDDHPYGNNHTWVKTLRGFNEFILGKGLKPLVLGESIAADTWPDREALLKHFGNDRPWYAPGVLDETGRYLQRIEPDVGKEAINALRPDSLRYGMLMRKFQVEAFRREIPYGGYVISVIRDIPNATMGLIDYLGQPKWNTQDWSWQRDTILLLETEADRRSFASGEPIQGRILLSHFGQERIAGGELRVSLEADIPEINAPTHLIRTPGVDQSPGTLASVAEFKWLAPTVSEPTRVLLKTFLTTGNGNFSNRWSIWVVPKAPPTPAFPVQIHNSVAESMAKDLFPGAQAFDPHQTNALVIASRFDDSLAVAVESGARLLLLPDGTRHSLPTRSHWFLRGAPIITRFLPGSATREMLLELQHFDLADDVVPNTPQIDSITPLLMLWDSHDEKAIVHTHGIIFETGIGKGRMLVSKARHDGAGNAAGRWLLAKLLERLATERPTVKHLPEPVWDYAKAKLSAEQTNLVERVWKFKPDPGAQGIHLGWQLPNPQTDADWSEIKIGDWWENQGYPALDGWAWYRLWVDIPQRWQGREVYLSFEGVDDIYEVFVNGELAGKGGDLATRKDALSEKRSWNISRFTKPGERALIAVRVHDWYGAGGIFRPVTLGTLPLNPELDFLR